MLGGYDGGKKEDIKYNKSSIFRLIALERENYGLAGPGTEKLNFRSGLRKIVTEVMDPGSLKNNLQLIGGD